MESIKSGLELELKGRHTLLGPQAGEECEVKSASEEGRERMMSVCEGVEEGCGCVGLCVGVCLCGGGRGGGGGGGRARVRWGCVCWSWACAYVCVCVCVCACVSE